MQTLPDTSAAHTLVTNADVASGGNAVITIAANSVQRHVIDYIGGGYYGTPDANTAMVVTDTTNNTILFQTPVTASGPIYFPLPDGGIAAPLGSAVTVTLEDGSQIKDLNIRYK
jgi:hypothetical protein